MLAAFLAALFFAFNATCANRSARALGGARANLGRLTVAVAVLAAFAHTAGGGLASASVPWCHRIRGRYRADRVSSEPICRRFAL